MHLANGQDQWKRGKYCRDHQTQKRDRTLLGPNQTSLTNTTKTQAQIMNGPKIVNPIGVQNECDTYTKMQCKSSFGKKKKKYKLLMQLGSSCLWDGHSRTHIRLQLSQVERRSVTRPFESSATTSNGGTFIRFPSESTSN